MAHPFSAQARSGSRAKFKAMVGKSGKGQAHPDEPQDRKLIKQVMAERGYAEGGSVSGSKSAPRADRYARGGKVGKVNINIVVPQKEATPPPGPILPPPGAIPPPGLAGPPGGLPLPPPGPPGPPMMRKAGGRVNKQGGGSVQPLEIEPEKGSLERLGTNTYRRELGRDPKTKKFGPHPYPGSKTYQKGGPVKKARGGRFTGGAETGVGRLEKASHQKGRRGR